MAEINTNTVTTSKEAAESLRAQGYGIDVPSAIEDHPYVAQLRAAEQEVDDREILQAPSAKKNRPNRPKSSSSC